MNETVEVKITITSPTFVCLNVQTLLKSSKILATRQRSRASYAHLCLSHRSSRLLILQTYPAALILRAGVWVTVRVVWKQRIESFSEGCQIVSLHSIAQQRVHHFCHKTDETHWILPCSSFQIALKVLQKTAVSLPCVC